MIDDRAATLLSQNTELTPEEAKEFVTFGSLEQIIKKTIEGIAKQDEISWEANQKCLELIVDQITDRINTERYERLRFEHFIIGLICSVNLLSKEKVLENYKQYCEEFDKLNKKNNVKE